jgi:Ca-activated chloride channel family protein
VSRLLLALVVILTLVGGSGAITLTDKMHSKISRGNRDYHEGEHESALLRYQEAEALDSTSAVPHFNAGDAFYRLGRFPDGARKFLKSTASPDDSVAAMSYYNLGNSMFKTGDLESAAEAYRRALLMKPDDEDAKYNLELALKLIEQQQQDQQDQQDQQQQQDQQDQQDQRDQQDQQQNQEEDRQQAEEQDKQQQQQDQQDQQQAQQQPGEISQEDLERILAAIESSDRDAQAEMLKKTSRRRRVSGKDW